jgi:hypothetical protein
MGDESPSRFAYLNTHLLRFFRISFQDIHPVPVALCLPLAHLYLVGQGRRVPYGSSPTLVSDNLEDLFARTTYHGDVYSILSSPGQCFASSVTLYPLSSKSLAVCKPITPALLLLVFHTNVKTSSNIPDDENVCHSAGLNSSNGERCHLKSFVSLM